MIKTKSHIIKILFIVFLSLMMMTGGIVFLCSEIATPPAEMEEQVDEVNAAICNIYVHFYSYGSNERGIKFEYRVTSGYSGNPMYSSNNNKDGVDVRRYSNISDPKSQRPQYQVLAAAGQLAKRFEFRSNSQGLGTNITGCTATIEGHAYNVNSMGGNYIELNAEKYHSDTNFHVNFYFDIRLPINLNKGTVNGGASYNGNSATSLYRSYLTYSCYTNTGSSVTTSYTYRPGISTTSSSIYTGGAQTQKLIDPVLPEQTVTLKPTRTGYTWRGFATTESGTTQIVDENGSWKLNRDSSALYPRTAYAKWEANKYTVTVNANGGSIPATTGWSVASGSATATKTVTFSSQYGTLPTPTRTGYTFNGWYTSATGGTKITSTSTVNNASNHTLYAQWTANNYSLTINPNSGSTYKNLVPVSGIANNWTTTGNNMTLTYTASQGVYTLTPANTSDPYSNLNYAVNLPAGTYVMNAVVTDASGNRLTGSPLQVFYGINYGYSEAQSVRFGDTTRVTFSITTAGNYNFRFDNDYGGNVMKVKQFWISSSTKTTLSFSYSLPYQTYYQLTTDEPTQTGYTFKGWSNASYLNVNSDGVVQNTSTSTQTRTAIWEEAVAYINFNANGGTEPTDKERLVKYNATYGENTNIFNTNPSNFDNLDFTFSNNILSFKSSPTTNTDFADFWSKPSDKIVAGKSYTYVIEVLTWKGNSALTLHLGDTANSGAQLSRGTAQITGVGVYYITVQGKEVSNPTWMGRDFISVPANKTIDVTMRVSLFNGTGATSMGNSYSYVPYFSVKSMTFPTTTRVGHEFTGWYTSASGGTRILSTTKVTTTSNQTLYAHWTVNNYTVTWNGNGASLDAKLWSYAGSTGYTSSNLGSNSSYTYSGKSASSSVTYGVAISYKTPIPFKLGNTFNGWWTSASGGYMVANTNGQVVASVSGYTDASKKWIRAQATTLYAQWTQQSYSISYNLNGGYLSSQPPNSYTFGTSEAIGIPTRTGHTFAGWTVTATLTGKAYATINLSSGVMEFNNSYPTAVYFPLFYQRPNVLYSGKGSDQNGEIRWRQYSIGGAYLGSNSGSSSVECMTSLWYHGGMNSATTTITWNQNAGFYTIPSNQTGNLTLVAKWTVNSYKLTAKANSGSIPATTGWTGSGATATKSVAYDTAYGTLPSPTRTGYGFAGWFTAASGGTQVSASTKMGAGNKTIYAHWTLNSYTLTANCNGGTAPSTLPSGWTANGTSPRCLVKYNSSYGTLPEPTRQGYIFAGWWTQASAGTEVDSSTKMGAADATIYAHWVESWVKYMSDDNPVLDQADGYYKIDSAAKLARLAYLVNYNIDNGEWANYQYKQTADIDLSGHYWQSIGVDDHPFGGTFDGKTFDINNLIFEIANSNIYNSNSKIGLFGYADGAQIDNVNVYNCNIKVGQYAGGIVGDSIDTYFKNCRVSGSIQSANAGDVGGIAGYITGDSEIRECESNAKVDAGNSNAGGIVGCGYSGSRIIDCVNIGNISGSDQIGGIVGCAEDITITGCVNNGYVYSNYDAGGIAGYAMSSVELSNCVNTGVIEGLGRVGGATSCTEGTLTIEYFVNTGNLINKNGNEDCGIGGMLGSADAVVTITSSFADCEISSGSTNLVGAFIGEDNGGATIKYCGARIKIVTATSNLAPFVKSSGICNDSYSLINNGGTQVNRITATSSGMDGKFGMIPTIHDGLPVPLGIYHVSQYGTTTGISSTLKGSKYGCTTA